MTWGEFKKWAEDSGVRDDMGIFYVDFRYAPFEVNINSEDNEFGIQ